MNETFTNKIGTEVFARYFFGLIESIPGDRVIDPEYQRLSKKSLINEEIDESYSPFPIKDWCKDEN